MEQIILNLVPGGVSPVCYVSQYDVGRKIRLHLRNGSDPYVLSGAETINATIRKVSGEELIYDIANTSASYVDLIVNYDATDVIGESVCELIITESGIRLGSANFKMRVDPDVYSGDQKLEVISATSETPDLSFETNVEENLLELKAGFSPVQDLHGYDHPWPAGGGVNLFDVSNINDTHGSNTLSISGNEITMTWVNGATIFNTKNKQIFEAGTYIVKGFGTNTNKVRCFFYKASDNTSLGNVFLNAGTPKTLSEPFYIEIGGQYDEPDTAVFKLQLELGSTAHDYHPYENICPIEGHTEANITRCGMNLWDEQWLNGYYNPSNGAFVSNANYICSKNLIRVSPSTQYYVHSDNNILIEVLEYRIDGTYIRRLSSGSKNEIITTDNECAYIHIGTHNSGDITTYTSGVSINYPATDHDYHAYNGQTYTIAFGQTVYGGQLIILPDRTYFHATHGRVNLGTLSSWNYHSLQNFWHHTIPNIKSATNDVLCEAYTYVNKSWGSMTNGEFGISGTSMRLHNDTVSTSAELEAQLNGIHLVYLLETPFDIDLTPVQISALLGENNVLSDTNGGTEVKFFRLIPAS